MIIFPTCIILNFPILFKAYTTEFNWGYWDRFAEMSIIQMAFAYHIHGWQGMGGEAVESHHFVSQLLQAFPMMIDEVMEQESRQVDLVNRY